MPRLEHIGIAVDDVAAVVRCLKELLNVQPYKTETVSTQQVRTHFLDTEATKLELLESMDADSAVQRFLDRRGEGLHHLAFEVNDAAATMERLRQAGFSLLSDSPQPGADEKHIFFVHPKDTHGVLVEFCETTSPRWSPKYVSQSNGRVAFYEKGDPDRPSLLFLHGAGGSTRLDTAPLMRRLESSFHVAGLDLSGHGETSLPSSGTLTMDRFLEEIHVALDALEWSSTHIFGFSLGSAVALRFAAAHPDRVNRLGLFAPNVEWDRPLAEKLIARLHLDALRSRFPERASRLEQEHQHPERLFPALRAFVAGLPSANEQMADTLATVSSPTLVTGLDEDPLFGREGVETVYQQLQHARLAILPGTRHTLADGPLSLLSSLLRSHFQGE